MSSNIISFPKGRQPVEIPTLEEIQSNIKNERESNVNQATDLIATLVFDQISAAGFPITNSPTTIKEICFCVESIRALMSKYYGVDHPFKELIETCFYADKDLNLIFKEPKFKFTVDEQKGDEESK